MNRPGSNCEVPYSQIHVYQTRSRLYVVGLCKQSRTFSILKVNRQDGAILDAVEDPIKYTAQECNSLLKRIHEGNAHHGGLQLVCRAYGVLGCFRFTQGFYLLFVTKREYVGSICGQKVYRVAETVTIPVSASAGAKSDASNPVVASERRYRKLLVGVDLTKSFFFSYTYCLAKTLQQNHDQPLGQHPSVFNNMFVWNSYLTRELRATTGNHQWVVPIIHGFWQQRTVSIFGRTITIALVARRSRHFAGTRYRKRGINDQGRVANEVETEQIVDAGIDWRSRQPVWSSVVQVRGSVPLYWSQQANPLSPKPEIVLQQFDPLYQMSHLHFEDLRARYGNPVVVLNLLKSKERRPRETLLRKELAAAVVMLNAQMPSNQQLVYIPWDFNKYARQPGANILLEISTVTRMALEQTGIYVHNPSYVDTGGRSSTDAPRAIPRVYSKTSVQSGVLRTNCIDCLDRTNVAQFAFGLMAFGRQLYELGLSDAPEVDSESTIAFNLMEMYEEMGHTLAMQYGGSEAHAEFFQRKKGEWEATTQSRDLVTSIRRFYSNTYTDAEKQDAINLFLGNFVPRPNQPHLWELDTDYYLHTVSWRHMALTQFDHIPMARLPQPHDHLQGHEQMQVYANRRVGQVEMAKLPTSSTIGDADQVSLVASASGDDGEDGPVDTRSLDLGIVPDEGLGEFFPSSTGGLGFVQSNGSIPRGPGLMEAAGKLGVGAFIHNISEFPTDLGPVRLSHAIDIEETVSGSLGGSPGSHGQMRAGSCGLGGASLEQELDGEAARALGTEKHPLALPILEEGEGTPASLKERQLGRPYGIQFLNGTSDAAMLNGNANKGARRQSATARSNDLATSSPPGEEPLPPISWGLPLRGDPSGAEILLGLTASDGITLQEEEGALSNRAGDSSWDIKAVFQQLKAREGPGSLDLRVLTEDSVVSFDQVLAKVPRMRFVRLYPIHAPKSLMWDAVQQAFAFFWTLNEQQTVEDKSTSGGSIAMANLFSPPTSPRPQSPIGQGATSGSSASFHLSVAQKGTKVAPQSAAQQVVSSRSSPLSPTKLLTALSNIQVAGLSNLPANQSIPVLNDILEVRTDAPSGPFLPELMPTGIECPHSPKVAERSNWWDSALGSAVSQWAAPARQSRSEIPLLNDFIEVGSRRSTEHSSNSQVPSKIYAGKPDDRAVRRSWSRSWSNTGDGTAPATTRGSWLCFTRGLYPGPHLPIMSPSTSQDKDSGRLPSAKLPHGNGAQQTLAGDPSGVEACSDLSSWFVSCSDLGLSHELLPLWQGDTLAGCHCWCLALAEHHQAYADYLRAAEQLYSYCGDLAPRYQRLCCPPLCAQV